MLDFRTEWRGDVAIVRLEGQLDALTVPDVRQLLDALGEQQMLRLVFDMQNVDQVDGSGLGAIVSLFKRVRVRGGELKLAGLSGQPKRVFSLLKLERAFELFDELERALVSFEQ